MIFKVTCLHSDESILINSDKITSVMKAISEKQKVTKIYFKDRDYITVKESVEEINELINPTPKKNLDVYSFGENIMLMQT